MTDEKDPVKKLLFEYIDASSDKFTKLAQQQKFSDIIRDIIVGCRDRSIQIENNTESVKILATGILHHILSCAMIPSQRKIKVDGIEADIVIPDLKTLMNDPKRALVICIPDTHDKHAVLSRLEQLQNIQPEMQNIWLVLSKKLDVETKSYSMYGDDPTLPKLIDDIAQFVNVHEHGKLKILRI